VELVHCLLVYSFCRKQVRQHVGTEWFCGNNDEIILFNISDDLSDFIYAVVWLKVY